ncbi:hypothetical protein [uncultured Ramlibacter sp.]|uniref:hypothetical protein n=1 Tax=uncultured Ramlibacter sp. TaxID=260755 RepID=UPI00263681C8|nr:hypothetical protein [uncultured Ramlibacter sp.]
MPLKHELSALVSRRIEEMGLNPLRLADLAQVRPEIVEALLRTEDTAISIAEAEKIANAVGLAIGVLGNRREKDGDAQSFHVAAQTASTSYRDLIPINVMREALVTGQVSLDYRPHIRTLLDEASVGLLARLADEIYRVSGSSPRTTWQIMRKVAAELACDRSLWH